MFKDDKKKRLKTPLQKLWYFIWEDDSPLSWAVNIVLAFVLIKFILYPGIGLLLGTTHPVVAVVSGSMEHTLDRAGMICGKSPEDYKNSLDSFWDVCGGFYSEYGITKENFSSYLFRNGFNTGDIIVLIGKSPKDIQLGDVIVFRANQPDPIIHRVINKWAEDGRYYFQTKGDHNPGMISSGTVNEFMIPQENVIGKAVFRIPWLGYIKIGFVQLLIRLPFGQNIARVF